MLRSGQSSLLVWGWYEIDGRTTGDRYAAKLLIAKAGLLGVREGCRALAVATEATPDVEPRVCFDSLWHTWPSQMVGTRQWRERVGTTDYGLTTDV